MTINGEVFKIYDRHVLRQTDTSILKTQDGGYRVVGHDREGDGFFISDVYDNDFNLLPSLSTKYLSANSFHLRSVMATELTDGGYVMAWGDVGDSNENHAGVFAQIYNADGTPRGNRIQFEDEYYLERDIQLVGLDGGGFGIAWVQSNARSFKSSFLPASFLKLQIVNANGDMIGEKNVLTADVEGHSEAIVTSPFEDKIPKMTVLKDGSIQIIWTLEFFTGEIKSNGTTLDYVTDHETVMNSFDANGVEIGARREFGEHIVEYAITGLQNGDYVMAYMGVSEITKRGDREATLVAQLYDEKGVKKGAEFVVDGFEGYTGYADISITELKDGSFVIVYTSSAQDGAFYSITSGLSSGNPGIYGRKFSADGVAQGGEFRVNIYEYDHYVEKSQASRADEGTQTNAHVIALDNGGFFVTFDNVEREYLDYAGIYGRMFGDGDVIAGGIDDRELTGTDKGDFISGLHAGISHRDTAGTTINAGAGNDIIHGAKGNDRLFGEEGNDYIEGAAGKDVIIDGLGNNVINAQTENDEVFTFSGINEIRGGDGADILMGGIHGDMITGGRLFDVDVYKKIDFSGGGVLIGDSSSLFGGADFLDGGGGGGFMMGGKGADTFFFQRGDIGGATIAKFNIADITINKTGTGQFLNYIVTPTEADFQPGVDKIELYKFSAELNYQNVLNAFTDTEEGVVFDYQNTEFLLYGIEKSELSKGDFSII